MSLIEFFLENKQIQLWGEHLSLKQRELLLGLSGSAKSLAIASSVKNQNKILVMTSTYGEAERLVNDLISILGTDMVYPFLVDDSPMVEFLVSSQEKIFSRVEALRFLRDKSQKGILVCNMAASRIFLPDPKIFDDSVLKLQVGQECEQRELKNKLTALGYKKVTQVQSQGEFSLRGDILDIFETSQISPYRIEFFGDEIEKIQSFDPVSGNIISNFDKINIYPANLFATSKETLNSAIRNIQDDLVKQVDFFKEIDKPLEAKRLQERTELDLEMIKELGYCSGIENYSRYIDGRAPGTRPFCLLDYFPKDFLMVIDESHVTIPQIHAMYGGDRSRKEALVEYGFRLPAAMDNRPLKFEEFEEMQNQVIYVSATPADYELEKTGGEYIEQIIRPTGLLDPIIEVRQTENQIDDLMEEIQKRAEEDERVLVTTLTKKMAEELTKYFTKFGVRTRYIHSDVETLERIQIMQDLRVGLFDVLVGVNLLREGLDLPEVSLVAILDADKEGMLRSRRSMIQTVGRAARNINGKAIMYADKITKSMQATIDETNYRREKQIQYNEQHGIVPKALNKKISETLVGRSKDFPDAKYTQKEILKQATEQKQKHSTEEIEKIIAEKQKEMEAAAKNLDFITAARLRDEIKALQE